MKIYNCFTCNKDYTYQFGITGFTQCAKCLPKGDYSNEINMEEGKYNSDKDEVPDLDIGDGQNEYESDSEDFEDNLKVCKCYDETGDDDPNDFLVAKRQVKKDNENFGRQFYCCARGKEDQCNFFEWCDGEPSKIVQKKEKKSVEKKRKHEKKEKKRKKT